MQFNHQSAVVTGAGVGIGFELCRRLVLDGASVILNDIDPHLAASAAKKINEEAGADRCISIAGDTGEIEIIKSLVGQAVERFGKLDIVIANAGITLFGDFLNYKPEAFYRVLQVNLGGSFFLTQQAAQVMKGQESGGSILLMSSVTGHQAHRNLAAYGMTKAALEMLVKNLVIELSPLRININAVAPGATLKERTIGDEGYEKTWSRITPMGRPATTKDIADAALFLVSNNARHITGQSLVVDGGWTSVSPEPF